VIQVGNFTGPTAAFTVSPTTGTTTTTFQFNGADSSPLGNITDFAWDFGDGASAHGQTASHQYAAAGTYTVRLTVTDSSGRVATKSQTVTVS
jgi:PKD repeat protein